MTAADRGLGKRPASDEVLVQLSRAPVARERGQPEHCRYDEVDRDSANESHANLWRRPGIACSPLGLSHLEVPTEDYFDCSDDKHVGHEAEACPLHEAHEPEYPAVFTRILVW
ncbi:MAG: hypothetical protein JWR83_695 [Aeromicrobium sp.]|nr:hypothetical protein [Aeromicrobium sp.]